MRTLRTLPTVLSLTLALAILAFVSQSGSAASSVFTPPSGWQRTVDMGNGLGVWVHPGDVDFKQNVNVLAQPYSRSLADFTKESVAAIEAKIPGAQFGAVQRTTVCGAHPATYITYRGVLLGRSLLYEQMMTIWRGTAYIATYTRGVGQPSIHEARSSLLTLCGGLATSTRQRRPVSAPAASPSPIPYLGPVASPQTYGSPAPTITPRLGP